MTARQKIDSHLLGAVSRTACWTAAARARESARPDRLFDDPLARALAGPDGPDLLVHFHTAHAPPDGNPLLPTRTRWFDDVLGELVVSGLPQVVALGSGLDTRPFRHPWPQGTVFFELDRGDILTYKERRLMALGAQPRCERRLVEANLSGDWGGPLLAAGYDSAQPTVWFGEGVLFYLSDEHAKAVLRQAAALSAPGAHLVVDLISAGMFRFPYMREFLCKLVEAGSPWRFGTDEPARFVADCGWDRVEVVEAGDPSAAYGRWSSHGSLDGLTDLPRGYFVTAERLA